jgi:hypothetical protein
MVDARQHARLIDFGSIVTTPQDCSWPTNLVQSFFVFVNELFAENKNLNGFWRSAPVHPFNLPQPWSNWLYAVWQEPVDSWNFALLLSLFDKKAKLPSAEQQRGATDSGSSLRRRCCWSSSPGCAMKVPARRRCVGKSMLWSSRSFSCRRHRMR